MLLIFNKTFFYPSTVVFGGSVVINRSRITLNIAIIREMSDFESCPAHRAGFVSYINCRNSLICERLEELK
jgi:hypothetical protein